MLTLRWSSLLLFILKHGTARCSVISRIRLCAHKTGMCVCVWLWNCKSCCYARIVGPWVGGYFDYIFFCLYILSFCISSDFYLSGGLILHAYTYIGFVFTAYTRKERETFSARACEFFVKVIVPKPCPEYMQIFVDYFEFEFCFLHFYQFDERQWY